METLTLEKTKKTSEYRGIVSNVKAAELPNEISDCFSDDPFEFEDTCGSLWNDTQRVYYHACIANRFSENYLLLCNQLEKNIKQLGSYCITKAVLEQRGMEFPRLQDLSVKELVCMVSFHFRKAHAALEGIYRDNDLLGLTYLNWEFRWVGLGMRLKATECKIRKIKEGSFKTDAVFEQSETFKGEHRGSGGTPVTTPQSLRANPSALPIKGAMAREMLAKEKEAEKQAEDLRKTKEKMLREAERLEQRACGRSKPFGPEPAFELLKGYMPEIHRAEAARLREQAEEISSLQDEEIPPGMIRKSDARRILMEAARERGDQETLREIMTEDEEAFDRRWTHHLEYDKKPGELCAAEVREILIEDARAHHDLDAVRKIPDEDYIALDKRWQEYLIRSEEKSRSGTTGPPPEKRRMLREKRKKKKR